MLENNQIIIGNNYIHENGKVYVIGYYSKPAGVLKSIPNAQDGLINYYEWGIPSILYTRTKEEFKLEFKQK